MRARSQCEGAGRKAGRIDAAFAQRFARRRAACAVRARVSPWSAYGARDSVNCELQHARRVDPAASMPS
eukprot:580228-Lingulodinium_polyedra.AAC.1